MLLRCIVVKGIHSQFSLLLREEEKSNMIIIERAGMAGHDQGRVLELALFCACDAHLGSVSPIHTRLIVGASSFNRPRLIAHRVHQTLA